jgi:hypothetical protein
MHAVLTVLGSVTGMKQMPRGAFSSVPITISASRSERTFQPSAWVQNRARPGRPRDLDGWRPPGPLRLQLFAAATPSRAAPIRGPAPGCAPRPLPVCLQQIDTRPPVMPAGPLRGYRSICHMLPGAEQPVRLDRAPRPAYGARGALTGASAGCLRTRQSPTVETNQRISFREYGSETACRR